MMKGEWKRSVKHVKQPRNPRRLVVKVGTSTLTRETGSLNLQNMEHLARVLADLEGMGYQPVLVSSGAIAAGRQALGRHRKPDTLAEKQAFAAGGPARLPMGLRRSPRRRFPKTRCRFPSRGAKHRAA